MKFTAPLIKAEFVARPNRYVVVANTASGQVIAHCADPGRLTELLRPGATLYLSPANGSNPLRKTCWDLRLVRDPANGTLVSLDTRVPNHLFEEGLHAGHFPRFSGWTTLARERPLPVPASSLTANSGLEIATRKSIPHSRIDFLLNYANGSRTWVEVKSASLVVNREARFPDAVTARGRRHLLELAELVRQGEQAAVVFIVQREDVDRLVAYREIDPAFAAALDIARAAGVSFQAVSCRVQTDGIFLEKSIPVG